MKTSPASGLPRGLSKTDPFDAGLNHGSTVRAPDAGPDRLPVERLPLLLPFQEHPTCANVPDVSSQRQWLENFATLLLERERSLASWQDLATETIPGPRRRSFRLLLGEVWAATDKTPLLEHWHLANILQANSRFKRWWDKGPCPLPPALTAGNPTAQVDNSAWDLPEIPTLSSLNDLIELHPDDMGWLLGPSHHYHQKLLPKRRGGRRLLESPKPLLKQTQRILLRRLLDRIPPHEAATGFRQDHSIIDFAKPHTGKDVVLKMDLAHFFPSLGRPRIKRLFMALGYRESVAFALASLSTTRSSCPHFTTPERTLYSRYHLPQGAPTSPALANLAAFRLDCRLAGLAKKAGATYTRYADDLLFSGDRDFTRQCPRFQIKVMAITLEEGLAINARKTRTMHRSQKQSAAGLILNSKLNARRTDYDQLKAILHNCRQQGPASQNHQAHPHFAAHLKGRVAWIASLNPAWGEKLQSTYSAIDWES